MQRSRSFRCRLSWLESCSPPPSASPGPTPPHHRAVGYFKARGSSKWETSINTFAFKLKIRAAIAVPTAKTPLRVLPEPGQAWAVHRPEDASSGRWECYRLALVGRPEELERGGQDGESERRDSWLNLRMSEKIRGNVPVFWLKLLPPYTNVYQVCADPSEGG